MAESKEVHYIHDQALRVILQKTGSGYHWEVHCQGANLAEILPLIREANNKLKNEYGKA